MDTKQLGPLKQHITAMENALKKLAGIVSQKPDDAKLKEALKIYHALEVKLHTMIK